MELDLVFSEATIVDGTGAPPRRGDVGVRDGRIAFVGTAPEGHAARRRIDASTLVLAPGFIDVHTHSDVSLLVHPAGESKVFQGVTTELVGNCGFSAFPVGEDDGGLHREHLQMIDQDPPPVTWNDLDGYAASLERRGMAINVATLVGHGALRIAAMGLREAPAGGADLDRLRQLVREAMDQGAFGLSTGLTYVPSMYGSTDELVALCEVVAEFDGIYATHARVTSEHGEFDAVREAIEIGRRSRARVEFSHLALNDPRNWGRGGELLELFDDAIADGVRIRFDVYPYDASSSGATQYLPPWVVAGGIEAMAERLQDPAVRVQALADLAVGWMGDIPWLWDRVTVCQAPPAVQPWVGRTMDAIAADLGVAPGEAFLDLCADHGNEVKVVMHYRSEEDMLRFVRHELALVGSDGNAIPEDQGQDRPHPRHFGCFPRVLGRYVRDRPELPLVEAVRKMTGATAEWLGLTDRGVVAPGLVADLAAFAPADVIDRATFVDPCRLSEGIRYVVVRGELVLDDGAQTGALPGRVLRR